MKLRWALVPFDALDLRSLHDLLRLRSDVFVVEQQCIYADVDGLDPGALHLLAHDGYGALAAYARLLPPDDQGIPHIGRVVVRPALRHRGIARELMLRAIDACHKTHDTDRCAVEAQSHLEPFYTSLGFVRQAPDHLLDGIPHVHMLRDAPPQPLPGTVSAAG
jgi:ElaA protein